MVGGGDIWADSSRHRNDFGQRSGPTSDELMEIKKLKNKVRDLKEANEILKQASIIDARELDPRQR